LGASIKSPYCPVCRSDSPKGAALFDRPSLARHLARFSTDVHIGLMEQLRDTLFGLAPTPGQRDTGI